MAKSFVITTTATELRSDAKGHAQAAFTVTNTTRRPIRGLVKAKPLEDTKQGWLSVQGEAERDFAAGATQQFTVSFDGPVAEPTGASPSGSAPASSVATALKYPFRLDVASAQAPEEDYTEGPAVTVEMMPTAATPRKKSRLWIIFVIAGVLLLIGVVVLIRVLSAPAPPTPTPTPLMNVALPWNGGIVSASSTLSTAFPPSGANNGDRRGLNWEIGGGWADATPNAYPDWLQIDFQGSKTISEIDVFTIQDNYQNPVEPTEEMTFSLHGIVDFSVQYWRGDDWVTVPGGVVTKNDKVMRRFTFTPITTTKVRVLVNNALNSYCRVIEIEVYGHSASTPSSL